MSAVSLVFPHQLFERHPAVIKSRPVYLVEEHLFFRQYHFHKQKLVFHRAAMKAYAHHLQVQGYQVHYVETHEQISDVRKLLPVLKMQGVSEIHCSEVSDNFLERRMAHYARLHDVLIHISASPLFLLTRSQVHDYFKDRKRYFQADFYMGQRKHFKILVDESLEPAGGKWSYDGDNRLKYPKGKTPPEIKFPEPNAFWVEAKNYVEHHFTSNHGVVSDEFIYPTTFKESSDWLDQFLQNRFAEFGDYEDAVVKKEHVLHHSLLTPMLNVGLLTPRIVLDRALAFAIRNKVSLNSTEGFVRQIIGWREFIRGVYEMSGTRERTRNYWRFSRKIPASFWKGTTGIPPIDRTIRKILDTGYCHHIERLMVLGNFMLLCEFDPDEVYQWFMELFIDAYDWVMVPNVYGMSQFADGGLMATKPYISGSNYLIKMSDFEKGNWQAIWDGLFWRFMHVHREFFLTNPRLGMLVNTFDKMAVEKQKQHLRIANDYLSVLDKNNS